MNKFLAGAIAGTAATVPMTMLMLYLHKQIPKKERRVLPPKQITVKVAKEAGADELVDEKGKRNLVSLVNHFSYGAAMAALYASFAPNIDLPPAIKGTAYGLAVWAGSYQGWLPLFDIREPATERPNSENAMMIASHIVWGAVMGVMVEGLSDRD
ncbi:MAG TPA: DUF1440 domain-containing protein [Pyrinomonadaceae bacterium]|nr:DUF1440 domain-containing protein [Pyrinomonadaceae bacterium]